MSNHQACILIAARNHREFLPELLGNVAGLPWPVIVVDDGSTDATPDCLRAWPRLEVITFAGHQGKGRALAAGLQRAGDMGIDLAVTVDPAGRFDIADIPRLVAAAGSLGNTLVIGAREIGQDGAPFKRRFGRVLSSVWVWLETGVRVPDTQSGFRVYPVKAMNALKIRSRRSAWEIEAIVRAAWSGLRLTSIPVHGSHAAQTASTIPFLQMLGVNVMLMFLRGSRWLLPPLPASAPDVWPKTLLGKFHYLWSRYLWSSGESAARRAAAMGVGVFCSIFPVWGGQTLMALVLARCLQLNRVLVVAASNLSVPPMIPMIVYAAVVAGHFVLRGQWVWTLPLTGLGWATAKIYFLEFLVGSCLLASLAGALAWAVSYLLLAWFLRPRAKV